MSIKELDNYTVCLLGWFYGLSIEQIRECTFTQKEIDEAQAYCEKRHIDPCEWYHIG